MNVRSFHRSTFFPLPIFCKASHLICVWNGWSLYTNKNFLSRLTVTFPNTIPKISMFRPFVPAFRSEKLLCTNFPNKTTEWGLPNIFEHCGSKKPSSFCWNNRIFISQKLLLFADFLIIIILLPFSRGLSVSLRKNTVIHIKMPETDQPPAF